MHPFAGSLEHLKNFPLFAVSSYAFTETVWRKHIYMLHFPTP